MAPSIDSPTRIVRGQSRAAGAREAVREFHRAVAQADTELVVFFCSSDYDLDLLAAEMNRLFAGIRVVGCTTAGEIGPAGYLEHSISGMSFPAGSFKVVSGCLENLQQFSTAAGQNFTRALLHRLEDDPQSAPIDHSFALLLIDGLSMREEPVTRAIQSTLANMPLIGGSAGDGVNFERTHLYFDGRFRSDCAILVLLFSRLRSRPFQTNHFIATDERLVVTEADMARRVVKEINGLPAAHEYARIVGVDVGDLDPALFSARPVVVLINGVSYVRSIQNSNADGSLTFYCAIANGLILRVAQRVNLLANLEQLFADIQAEIGQPQLVIGCDCLLRKLEIFDSPDKDRVIDLLLRHNTTGFCTYGEQFRGVHLNQTFTGVAIGAPSVAAEAKNA